MTATAPQSATDGRVVKRAADAVAATRLTAEADVLAAGQMPGVVELVGLDNGGEWPTLMTTRVDGPDLGRAHDLNLEEAAGVVAAVATTVADLHDLGLVHGAVIPSHILVGPDGGPVLCGFAYGGRAGAPPVATAALPDGYRDPARAPGDPLAPSADVYALGALLGELVSAASRGRGPGALPARRVPMPVNRRLRRLVPADRPRRRQAAHRLATAALLAVADRATTADPQLRPGARSLASAVGEAVPGARLPRRSDPEPVTEAAPLGTSALQSLRRQGPETPSPAVSARRLRVALAGGLVVMAVATMLVIGRVVTSASPRPASPSATPVAAPPPALSEASGAATTSATMGTTGEGLRQPDPAVTVGPPRSCPAVSSPLSADTDGNGCPEALQWSDGVLEAGDRRWTVGRPDDRVATADWSCSGRATLALLRPATGEVFIFDGWADAGHDLSAELVGRVEGGFALRTAEVGDGCPLVAVDRGDAAPVTIPARHRP